jgi:hypothetical protein
LRRDIGKRAQVDKQLLVSVERVHSFLVARPLRYQVTDTEILFISNDDLQEYNRLMAEVQSGAKELDQLGAESAQKRAEWDSMRWLR